MGNNNSGDTREENGDDDTSKTPRETNGDDKGEEEEEEREDEQEDETTDITTTTATIETKKRERGSDPYDIYTDLLYDYKNNKGLSEEEKTKRDNIGVLYRYYQREPYYKKLKRTRIQGDYYLTKHSSPQCIQCGRELKKIDPVNRYQSCVIFVSPGDTVRCENILLDGFFKNSAHGYIHYQCDIEVEAALLNRMIEREDLIVKEVSSARKNRAIIPCGYDIFDESTYKYCVYCEGLVTDIKTGFLYPSESRKKKYLSLISSSSSFNHKHDTQEEPSAIDTQPEAVFVSKKEEEKPEFKQKYRLLSSGKEKEEDFRSMMRTETNSHYGLISLARHVYTAIHHSCYIDISNKPKYNEKAYYASLIKDYDRDYEQEEYDKEEEEKKKSKPVVIGDIPLNNEEEDETESEENGKDIVDVSNQ